MKKIILLISVMLFSCFAKADGGWYGDKVRSSSNLIWTVSTTPPVIYAGDWLEGEIWLWYQDDPGLGAQFVYTINDWATTQYDLFSRGTVSGNDSRYSNEGSAIGPWETGTQVKYKIQCWHDWYGDDFYTTEASFTVQAINPPQFCSAIHDATDPDTRINLEWEKNSEGFGVMIVRKLKSQEWTEPVQGVAYSVSDNLGDGVVIYNSNGTSYANTGLNASREYDYRFYSVNNNYYSDGVSVSSYTSFANGTGVVGDPYLVGTAADLNIIRYHIDPVELIYFSQTADIDLTDYSTGTGWAPIENFKGIYNGQGHTISNLTIDTNTGGDVGLFSNLETGKITDLGLLNVDITGGYRVGALAGSVSSMTEPTGIMVENCYSTGTVTGYGAGYVGGLVGYLNSEMITCYSSCDIDNTVVANTHQYVGGLAGGTYKKITSCYATGSVSAPELYYNCLGGLVGIAGGANIENCFSTGFINYYGIDLTYAFTGGLAGRMEGVSFNVNSFYDQETSGQTGMIGDGGKTTAEMKTMATFTEAGWNFTSTGVWAMNGTTNNGYPFLRIQGDDPGYYWLGETSSDWSVASNWSEGVVPDELSNVIIINATNDAVATNVDVKSITIEPVGKLTVSGTMTLDGGNSGLILKSNADGCGSLIHSGSVSATVQSYLTKYLDQQDDMYHFLSSPVAAQPISPQFSDPPNNATSDFYKFDEASYMWINFRSGDGTEINPAFESNFTVGRGYLVAYPVDVTKTFSGVLNSGTLATGTGLPALTNAGSTDPGWNLIGNPYPSAIDWDNVVVSQYSDLENAVYVYDNASSTYYSYVDGVGSLTDGIIPAMQGFFVHADGPAPALTLENADRVHSGTSQYKKSVTENLVHLKITGNNRFDETYIRFTDMATSGFDRSYDAYKLTGGSAVPTFYTTAGEARLSVNSLPLSYLNGSVPLSVAAGAEAVYTITLAGNSLPSETKVILEDTKTGVVQPMNTQSEYTFNAAPGDDADRFLLRFVSTVGIDTPTETPDILTFLRDGELVVQGILTTSEIRLLNAQGQVMLIKQASGSGMDKMQCNHLSAGIYLINVVSNSGSVTRKIFINH